MILLNNNLQAFLNVVQHRTVVSAAKNMGLTQTGVTQRIKSLEREVGTSLFIRSRSGMKLTPEGEALLKYCLRAEELEGNAKAEIEGAGKTHPVSLTIAGPTSLISSRVVERIGSIYQKWPHIRISLLIDDSENRIKLLKIGSAQIAILRPENVVDELDSKLLKNENYLLVGPTSWKGRKIKDIVKSERIIDFHDEDPTTKLYLSKYELLDFARSEKIYANENRTLVSMIRQGIGYGTLNSEIAAEYIERKELIALNSSKTLQEKIALAWYPRNEMPGYFEAVIKGIN